jgi:3',5'-cyclic-AMP phosphodiesterase
MLIAQITDTHIREAGQLCCGRVDTSAFLTNAIAKLNSLRPLPDVVVVTGDLVDSGGPAEYAQLRALLTRLEAPFYLVMGNHDDRENLRAAFADHTHLQDGTFIQYTVDEHAVRVVVLDTNIPGESAGSLCAQRVAWLNARLAEQPTRPTLIAMHHPPFKAGNLTWDRLGLSGADGLHGVVSRYGNVEAIICGHLHRPTQTRFAGTLASTCPSTAHQLHFGLGDSPFGFAMEPPSFQLHFWNGASLVTHTALIETFEGPYSFREGAREVIAQRA